MFVFPINPAARLPEAFNQYALTPKQPATLAPEIIAANRDHWVEAWAQTVLH
jgi:thiamine transport system substrate-binding protein